MAADSGKQNGFKWNVDEKPVKIDKWDGSALKNALDDEVKKVISEHLGYKECHKLMDSKLLICTIAVGFAGFALLWDFLHPFPQSRPILILCVLSYFFLMVVLTIFTSFKEQNKFLVAVDKDKAGLDPDNIWTLSSYIKRYDHIYHLTIDFIDGQTKAFRTATISKSVANYFDEDGVLCSDIFDPEIKKIHDSLLTDKKKK